MRRNLILVVAFLLLSVTVIPVSSAQGSLVSDGNKVTSRIVVDSDLTIQKRADGRIVPVKNAEDLSHEQLNNVLDLMNFSDDMLADMSVELKQKLVSVGGIRIDVETELKQYFRTSDGRRLLVTEENKEEIEQIKQKEISKYDISTNEITPFGMGSIVDGTFSGQSLMMYVSSTTAEYELLYIDRFGYSANVRNKYTDKMVRAWQSHTTSIGREASAYYEINFLGTSDINITTSHNNSLTGSSATIPLPQTLHDEIVGEFIETVRVPKTEKDKTGKWVIGYAHPWTLLSPSITIGPTIVTFGSFIGDEWEWESTYTIGNLL